MAYTRSVNLDTCQSCMNGNRPEITEEFANKMVNREKALDMLEVRTETDPSKKIKAFKEVAKNEGTNILYYSADKLLVLVSEALRNMNGLYA